MSEILQELERQLTRVLDRDGLGSGEFADWVDDRHWDLLEGKDAGDTSPDAVFTRDLLYEIIMDWEILKDKSTEAEFPVSWVRDWLSKVQARRDASVILERIRNRPRINPAEHGLPDSTDMIRENRERGYSELEEAINEEVTEAYEKSKLEREEVYRRLADT